MGMSIEELYEVIEARKKSGENYMFLETTVFGREFFYVQEMYKKGELGKIQYTTCAHLSAMEGGKKIAIPDFENRSLLEKDVKSTLTGENR